MLSFHMRLYHRGANYTFLIELCYNLTQTIGLGASEGKREDLEEYKHYLASKEIESF